MKAANVSISMNVKPSDLHEDDLAMEIDDEYDPMIPNSYEQVVKDRRAEREKQREEEVTYYNNVSACRHLLFSMHTRKSFSHMC